MESFCIKSPECVAQSKHPTEEDLLRPPLNPPSSSAAAASAAMSSRSSSSSMGFVVCGCLLILLLVTGIQSTRDGGSHSIKRNSGSDDKCSRTSQAVLGQCDFVYQATEGALQVTGLCNKSGPQRTCQSCPDNGGVGDVTRIETTVSGGTISDVLCSNCGSGEVLDNDVTFCSNSFSENNVNKCNNPFGPCPGVKVYRCSCEPTTTASPPPPLIATQTPQAPVVDPPYV